MQPSLHLRRLDRATPAILALVTLCALTVLVLWALPTAEHAPLGRLATTPATTASVAATTTAGMPALAAPPQSVTASGSASRRRGVLVPYDPSGGRAPPPDARLVYIDASVTNSGWWWSRPTPSLFNSPSHFSSKVAADYEVFVFAPFPEVAANLSREWGKGEGDAEERGPGCVHIIPAMAAATDEPAASPSVGKDGGREASRVATDGTGAAKVDFAAWLGRTFTPDDYLLCRLDLEGGESAVLRRLLLTGLLCRCARLSVEWHMWVGTAAKPHITHFNDPVALKRDINVFELPKPPAAGAATAGATADASGGSGVTLYVAKGSGMGPPSLSAARDGDGAVDLTLLNCGGGGEMGEGAAAGEEG
ncbi:hypothetical protein MMPV_009685 [Pyropia vietnamensis]